MIIQANATTVSGESNKTTNALQVKASQGSEKRRFLLVKENGSATFSFVSLMDKLKSLFSIVDAVTISYLDDEDDVILINTDLELESAAALLKEGETLKLEITPQGSKPAVESAGEEKVKKAQKLAEKEAKRAEKFAQKQARREAKAEEKPAETSQERCKKHKTSSSSSGEEAAGMLAERRAEKQAEREQKRKEREAQRELKKKERQAAREAEKNESPEVRASKRFAEGVSYLYLDGNNMLFVADALRKLVIKQKKRESAERLLTIVAQLFHKKLGTMTLTEIMFDDTNIPATSADGFKISNAKKSGFKIADDALVDIATKLGKEEAKKALFITSDEELKQRLREQGAKLLGPKAFLLFALQQVNEDKSVEGLNEWFLKLAQVNAL